MTKLGKKYKSAAAKVDIDTIYSSHDAMALVK